MTMNPFEQSRQQLLHYLTSNAEQEVIDYIRQEISRHRSITFRILLTSPIVLCNFVYVQY